MSNVKVGLIIEGDSRDARREIDRTEKEVDQLKRGNRELGRASQNYGRRAVQANRRVARSTRDLGQQTMKLKGLVAGLGAAYLAMRGISAAGNLAASFKDAASEAEGFRVRLNTLLGSVYEGNRAFDEMAEFAGTVPFEYREIMAAATDLSGVLEGGVDDIKTYMPIIADLAAVSGLSIQETTSQVIRMYSAGAASADMFRERGVLAMLGFQAGVSYSAEETRRTLIQAWEDPASKFRGATEDLAQNWTGMMSMISDSWFQFRDAFMEDTVLWDFLKTALDEFRMWWADALDWSQSEFDAWASGVITALKVVGVGFTTLWDVALAPKRVFTALQAVGATINEWIIYPLNLAGMVSDETYQKYVEGAEAARNRVERLNQTTSDFLAKMDEIESKARNTFQMRQVNASIEEAIAKNEELFGSQKRVTEAMQETGQEGQKAMGDLDSAIDKLIQKQELFAADWKKNLQERLAATEQSLRTELENLEANRREQLAIIEAAERQGLRSTMSYAEMRRRVDEQYIEDRRRLEEQGSAQMEEIWSNAVENMQREFSDTIYNALWEDGISSFEDFGKALLDIWKRTIAEMVAAWVTSGIASMLSGDGFGGFSIDVGGGSGNNVASMAVNKMFTEGAKKGIEAFQSTEMGQTVAGWFGQGNTATATALGESGGTITSTSLGSGSIATGSGITTLGGGNTIAGLGGGASGATVTGGSAGAGLGGGSTAGGSAAGGSMSAAAGAGAVAALAAIGFHQISIPTPSDRANRAFKAGLAPEGPFGTRVTQAENIQFAKGPHTGFATDYARNVEGVQAFDTSQGLGQFNVGSPEQLVRILERAQEEFEKTKNAGAIAFADLGVTAADMGQKLQDGVVDRTEAAAIGLQHVGEETVNARTGVTELGGIGAQKMNQLIAAINNGEIRVQALTGKVQITQSELEILGEIGLAISGDLEAGASNAAQAFLGIGRAIDSIPSEKVVTIRERRVGGGGGGGGSDKPPRRLAEGGLITSPTLAWVAEAGYPEVVLPVKGGRVKAEISGGGGGVSNALLRSIDARLANLQATTSLDDSSIDRMRQAIAEPIAKEQRRETRHRDRQAGGRR